MIDGEKKLIDGTDDMLPLGQEICQMSSTAIQLSSTRIVRMLLTTIDSAFLGHLGTQQLAGSALSGMWQGVPSSFVQFVLQAETTLAAQARGAGNNKLVGEWLQTTLFLGAIGSLPVMAIFWNVHKMVAITMTDPGTVDYARQFSQMMMWSLPPQYAYVALTSYFSCIGVVLPATFCTCFTVCANIFFNWFFIYGYGSFKGFGFVGSPMATVTSSYLQLFVYMFYVVYVKEYHKDYWCGWSKEAISASRLRTFLALGVPTGLSSVVDWGSGAIAGSFSGLCGVDVAAGQNVLNSLFALTYSTVSGFSTATQIRLARYLGEGKPSAAKRILNIGSATLLMGGVIMCILLTIFHTNVWGVWTADPKLKALCNTSMVAFMAGLMMAYLRFTLTVVSVSLGPREARINLAANNIASWAIYIPLAYLMPISWGWGLSGFWWSDFFGEAFKVLVLSWCVSNVDWQKASLEARAKSAALGENPEECEKMEKEAFQAVAGYSSPAPNTTTSNVALHSPNILTRKAADQYEKGGDGGKFQRTPSQKQKANLVHIDDV
jgi:MATE family multidrug resistance protein